MEGLGAYTYVAFVKFTLNKDGVGNIAHFCLPKEKLSKENSYNPD